MMNKTTRTVKKLCQNPHIFLPTYTIQNVIRSTVKDMFKRQNHLTWRHNKSTKMKNSVLLSERNEINEFVTNTTDSSTKGNYYQA